MVTQGFVRSQQAVYVTGLSAGLPGQEQVFAADNLTKLLRGANCLEYLDGETKRQMLERNIHVKNSKMAATVVVNSEDQCIQVAGRMKGSAALVQQFGVSATIVESMDNATQFAVAAGLDALQSAGLASKQGKWRLEESVGERMGVIYATSLPLMTAVVEEANRFHDPKDNYEYDRKFLFQLAVLANAQLAQITGAYGPNTQINAACAGSTQAIGMARDWLALKKCDRVLVVASDLASSPTLFPIIGSGFRALGAASIAKTIEAAARPFDEARNGMVLSSGAIGMVLESASAEVPRLPEDSCRVVLMKTHFANSAFHGVCIAIKHVSRELKRFLDEIERDFGITREDLVRDGVYYSHETFTNASVQTSCATAEIQSLRFAFGDELVPQLMIINTKGATGHPMAVSFEDVVAVEALRRGIIPPVVNFQKQDPAFGVPIRISKGGVHPHKYALRYAGGFGSQVSFAFYALEHSFE